MAERWRNRRRLTGSGCASPRSSSLGWTSVGHAHQFYQGSGLWVSSWHPGPPGAFRLRRFLISTCRLRSRSLLVRRVRRSRIQRLRTAVDVVADRPADPRIAGRVADPAGAPRRAAARRAGRRPATCDQGWATPEPGTPQFTDPLGIIRRTTGVKGPLVVVDMRRFIGPESPPSEQGYLLAVERWYIKLYAEDDIAFQGRFLVEARRFGRGLAAVAPYDTEGFESPDWVGFQFDSASTASEELPGPAGTVVGHPVRLRAGRSGTQDSGAARRSPRVSGRHVGRQDGHLSELGPNAEPARRRSRSSSGDARRRRVRRPVGLPVRPERRARPIGRVQARTRLRRWATRLMLFATIFGVDRGGLGDRGVGRREHAGDRRSSRSSSA